MRSDEKVSWRDAANRVGAKSPRLAVALWRKICASDIQDEEARVKLALALIKINHEKEAEQILNQFKHREDACIALSGLLLKINEPEQCLDLDGTSIEMKYNRQTALRQLGRYDEAIELAWRNINNARPEIPKIKTMILPEKVTIVCVKWGKKYDAAYVNRLYFSLQRFFLHDDFSFICFTDNSENVRAPCRKLPSHAPKGWWAKAFLFSAEANLQGTRVCYFDLDTIITVSDIAQYIYQEQPYQTLGLCRTCSIQNESRSHGFNSSIMTWTPDSHFCDIIFSSLTSQVHNEIYKFDHWLEMLFWSSKSYFFLPWPILDYRPNRSASDYSHAIVLFPLYPKPHHLLLQYDEKHQNISSSSLVTLRFLIFDHWISLDAAQVEDVRNPENKILDRVS
mmetsp:Transcript_14530/g.17592  ORF Transcript_14530/g.17592 Transcript_14530/m.17592 type:complete len:395 (-) Transcript_14530:12-1196(-)